MEIVSSAPSQPIVRIVELSSDDKIEKPYESDDDDLDSVSGPFEQMETKPLKLPSGVVIKVEKDHCVGVQNNNKRKESTRVREVCSNCQFFLAKQVHFHLASRLSKSRVKTRNRKVSKMDNRKDAETGSS